MVSENLSIFSINLLDGEEILKFLLIEVEQLNDLQGSRTLVENFSDAIEERL